MNPKEKSRAYRILSALPDWGPVNARRALEWAGGDWERLFGTKESVLSGLVGRARAARLANWWQHFDPEREESCMEANDTRFVLDDDPAYPAELRRLEDAPLGLYWQGKDWPRRAPAIAIVGTRHATPYGRKIAAQFTRGLMRAGFTIVSGLALGIDAEAHRVTLDGGGSTAAVLGHGIDISYPAQNRPLFERMREAGCVLSEFPFGRRPDRQSFPQRNRIVSGMCCAVLVVETSRRGGSLITARFAMEQHRSVFVIPARVDQVQSLGCLDLIRDGATLVTSVDDILEELRFMQLDFPIASSGAEEALSGGENEARRTGDLGTDERCLLECLLPGESLHLDQLCESTGFPSYRVQAALMMLELQRLIARQPGGTYERV